MRQEGHHRMNVSIRFGLAAFFALVTANAYAWSFPFLNLTRPDKLQKLIDELEQSAETRALAYVSEDKIFSSKPKHWAWAHHTGNISQEEANRIAVAKCEIALRASKAQNAGGKPRYDFGDKQCELYEFSPNVGAPVSTNDPPKGGSESGDGAHKAAPKELAAATKDINESRGLRPAAEVIAPPHQVAPNVSRYSGSGTDLNPAGMHSTGAAIKAGSIEEAQQRVVTNPADHPAWYSLGNAYKAAKQYDNALRAYQAALKLKPGDGQAMYGMGETYHLLSNRDKVRETYLTLGKVDKDLANQFFKAFILP